MHPLITFLLFALVTKATLRSRAAVPEPIAGWRMELVAESPRIKHPSVVACAPDGRIFVAEDPMDISLPNANASAGRILCFHRDGKTTVFAENLYAVFGLQYLEGKVYVLHNPKFSVFDDNNGIGANRRDLIEQTLPDPSALNWNDHIPANFRLAMDGYFYVASGDKGLYRARGTDGSTATLSTGGIFRIRPDGSQLEVFCDGVRNILDVAVNSEDEIFSYDNTDEHDWMGRFTHMVEAGFYGYPHDFIPRRPYTLWMMDDFGPGAACGAFAYNEDALPVEFHGNVFLSDFGKRQLIRVRVERDGATYRVTSREDMFPNPPGDFRPVGITLSPDGKSIYICDWQHRDEKEEVSVGRLWKLTWIGQDQAALKPAWYLPAALGQKSTASNADLIRGLSHPSQNVRLTAQRALASARATNELVALLSGTAAPPIARVHALWALNALDQGRAARNEIISLVSNPDATLRRQAIRQLARTKWTNSTAALRTGLKDSDTSVRFQAATAVGRVGDPSAIPDLIAALDEPDLFARFAMFTALRRIGTNSPAAFTSIAGTLVSENERIREGIVFALRETYDVNLLNALTNIFHNRALPIHAREDALKLIAEVCYRKAEWRGEWGAYHPALQPPPPKTQRWAGTATVLQTLRRGLRESDLNESEITIRRTCIDALASARDTNSAATLRNAFAHSDPESGAAILRALGAMKDRGAMRLIQIAMKHEPPVSLAAIQAAGELGGEEATKAVLELLRSPAQKPIVTAQAINVLSALQATPAVAEIEKRIHDSSAIVRAASVQALGRLKKTNAVAELALAVSDNSLEVRAAAVKALDQLHHANAVPALLEAYREDALRADALFALCRIPDERALDPLLEGISSKNPAQRNAAHLAIRDLAPKVLSRIEAKADSLPTSALTELRQIYAGNKEAESGRIFARQIQQHTLDEYFAAASRPAGNPENGRKLFNDASGVNCISCHRVAGIGNDTGPDLSNIGAQFDRRALAESILYPSKAVREGYQQINIETTDDESFSGVVKAESADFVTLRDSSGREQKIPRASIKSRVGSSLSLMPEGLQAALSLDEFADLIAYLSTLKSATSKPSP